MASHPESQDTVCLLPKITDSPSAIEKLRKNDSLLLSKRSPQIASCEHSTETIESGSEFVLVTNTDSQLNTAGINDVTQYRGNKQKKKVGYSENSTEIYNQKDDSKPDRKIDLQSEEKKIAVFESDTDEESCKSEISQISSSSQSTHSNSSLALKTLNRMKEIQGFRTSGANESDFNKVQTLSRIKEQPSAENSVILSVSENYISLDECHEIDVTCSIRDKREGWEVEPGFAIFKSLNPVAYSPSHTKIIDRKESKHSHDLRLAKWIVKEKYDTLYIGTSTCMEFLSPVEFSKLFVTNTIDQAREMYLNEIFQYGDPEKMPPKKVPPPPITSFYWASIKRINKEDGIFLIEKYIVSSNSFRENWKYTIWLDGIQSDESSDYYFYSANFSLPTRLYPIAQVTATLYFQMEVARVIPPRCPIKVRFSIEGSNLQINPDNFVLNDKFFFRVLDAKIKMFKSCTI